MKKKGKILMKYFFNLNEKRKWKDTEQCFEIKERLPGTDFFTIVYEDLTKEYKTGYAIASSSILI